MLFKKRFVSVYISSTKLQVVEIVPGQKKVRKFVSLDTPKGLVSSAGVSDIDAFSQAIKTIWKKLGIKEKNVEVVIPELSTQVKSFDLPLLDDTDIDEAIRWRIMDYLPDELSEFVLDWEIVDKNETGLRVMSVVVRKKILESYILGFEKASLLPLLVTTPSTAFFNSFANDGVGRLVLFSTGDEVLMTLGKGKTILASSVASLANTQDALTSVTKMIKYYSGVKIEKLLVGGEKNILSLSGEVEKFTGLQSGEVFSESISGMSPVQVQSFLVPLISQLKDATDPSDEATINLLPLELSKKYAAKRTSLRAWSLTLFITLVVWFAFSSTIVVYFYLGSQSSQQVIENDEAPQSREQIEVVNQVKSINSLSQRVVKITDGIHSPEVILNDIYQSKPGGIELIEYYLDLESGDIRLVGSSLNRVSLIDFKYKLEENSNFSLVSVPVSNFENDSNFEFEMNFSYLPLKASKVQPKR